jgi:hypothetical protein
VVGPGGLLYAAVGNVAHACVLPGGGAASNVFVETGGSGGGLSTGPDGLRLFPILIGGGGDGNDTITGGDATTP